MTNKHYSMHIEKVTSASRRLSLLNRFKEQFSILSVTLPDSNSLYTSAIIDILPRENCLVLDELAPPDGHRRFLRVGRCTVEVFSRGQGLSFASRLISKGLEDGIAFYRIALPSSISYYLQRTAYRVSIPLSREIPLRLRDPNDALVEAEVVDLSLGGIGFKLPCGPWADQLAPGTALASCRCVLDTGELLDVDLKVKYAGPTKDRKYLRIGAEFVNLGKQQQQLLERYIRTLDRARLQALARAHYSRVSAPVLK